MKNGKQCKKEFQFPLFGDFLNNKTGFIDTKAAPSIDLLDI